MPCSRSQLLQHLQCRLHCRLLLVNIFIENCTGNRLGTRSSRSTQSSHHLLTRSSRALLPTRNVIAQHGDHHCPDLLAASVYDTKPVHFLTMISESIRWMEKERGIFDPTKEEMVGMKFLRLNINDEYNMDMGHVNVADQLRGYYQMDHWQRQYKWWWSIWLWEFGVLLVNAYVFYKKVMEESGVPKKNRLTQYEFRREIALAWIQIDECSVEERKRKNLPLIVCSH
jgi:hypothetical protein